MTQEDKITDELEKYKKALHEIAFHSHNAYSEDPVLDSDSSSYSAGVTYGHCCAANIARKALGEPYE